MDVRKKSRNKSDIVTTTTFCFANNPGKLVEISRRELLGLLHSLISSEINRVLDNISIYNKLSCALYCTDIVKCFRLIIFGDR